MGILVANRKKLLATGMTVAALWALVMPVAPTALANHPADTCLDVEPETDSNPTGTAHQITATIRTIVTTPPAPPSTQPPTVTCTGPAPTFTNGNVNIDFEVTGPNDPDNSLSPETPDMSCDVGPTLGATCTVSYVGTQASMTPGAAPNTQAGRDIIRGWIDHDGDNPAEGGVVEADLAEGRDETAAPGTGCVPPPSLPEPDCTDVVDKEWTASRLDCTPETASNQTGQPHTITCTATDEEGNRVQGTRVDGERTGANDTDQNSGPPDHTCTTNAQGQCTITHAGTRYGTTTYRFWIDDDGTDDNINEGDETEAASPDDTDDTDVVTKNWTASNLDCRPETATNRSGEVHEIECTATDEEGNGVPGTEVDAESSGANDPDNGAAGSPDYTCTTDSTGKCTLQPTHRGTQSGTTTYRAWIDDDGNDDNINEGDQSETQCAAGSETTPACSPVTPGSQAEEDDTDVVTKTWTSGSGTTLDCDDESGDDRESNPGSAGESSNETYTCTVRDASGNLVSGETVRGEVRGPPDGNGVNDPDNPDSTSYESPDYSCTTRSNANRNEEGTCEVLVTQADSELGTAEICFWIGAVEQGAALCDKANEPTDEPEGNDAADQVEKTWFQSTPSSASRLDCTPETDRNPAGSSHTITCTVTTAAGAPVGNAEVDAEASGANDPDGNTDRLDPDFSCVTAPQDDPNTPGNEVGTCQFTHGSTGPNSNGDTPAAGTTTYRAWIDFDNDDDRSEADAAEGRCSTGSGDEQGCAPPVPGPGCITPPVPGEPDCTDVVEKTWGASRLDCEPETATNRTGDAHTVRCTATDENGDPVSGGRVHAEASGAGDPDSSDSPESPDFTCTPAQDDVRTQDEDETGTCEFTHTSQRAGNTTYTAWMDDDTDATTPDRDAGEGADAGDTGGEPAGGTNDPGDAEDPDDTDVVTKTWTASRLDCAPETDTNPPGRQHTITCSATDEEGNGVPGTRIQGEANGAGDSDGNTPPPDYSCTTAAQNDPATTRDETKTCEFTHTSNQSGTTTYRFWIDEDQDAQDFDGDRTEAQCAANDENGSGCTAPNGGAGSEGETDTTDVVTKTWAAALDCEPETDSNPTGQPHTITCTVSAADDPNERGGGLRVDAEATGAGDPDDGDKPPPDFTCTTATQDDPNRPGDQTGTCSFTHTSREAGETVYRAWVDDDGDDENVNEGDTGEARGQTDTDDTDVVTKTWTASRLDCAPETATNPSGEPHRITCSATDEEGNAVGGTRVDAEATGAGDPDDGDKSPPDFTCTTASRDDTNTPDEDETGTCSFTHTSDGAGQTTYRAWIDDDQQADNVDEGDVDEAPTEQDNDDTDVVTKRWAAARLDCQPETATNPTGTSHTVTCTARDDGGRPAGGQTVVAEADGANDDDGDTMPPDFTCETATKDDQSRPGDQTGTCSFTHQSDDEAGTTTYRAWVDQDGDTSTSEADDEEARCADEAEGCTPPEDGEGDEDEPDSTDVVSKTWTAVIDCLPENDTNPTGSPHTVTCRATSTNGKAIQGVNVDAEATGDNDPDSTGAGSGNSPQTPDFTCTTGSNGECAFTHGTGGRGTTGSAGETTYRAWADDDGDASFDGDGSEGPDDTDDDDTDVVRKAWAAPGLDCSPEQAFNPTGTTHRITCTARDVNSQPVANRNIDVEALGVNDPDSSDSQNTPDFTCDTGQDGSCTVTHAGNTSNAGVTTYRAWMDDANPGQSEADQTETRDQNDNDNTDVVEKRWVAGRIDCTPETDTNPTGTPHQVTCTVRDGNNLAAQGTNVDVEAAGANDPDGSNSPQTPDFTCTTGADGSCTVTHGGATGAGSTNAAGTTTYRAWVDVDQVDSTNDGMDQTENRDEQGNGAGARGEPDHTDVVEKTWVAGQLDCSPETSQNPVGSSHTVTCTARDAAGNVVSGTTIDVEVSGANDRDNNAALTAPDYTCTTGASGSCSFTHGGGGNNGTSDTSGTSVYRAWIDADGSDATAEADATEARDETAAGAGGGAEPDATDVVEKTWVTPPRTISCTPATDTNPTNTDHVITCTVHDRSNQPVSGQSVTFTSTGVGAFRTQSQQTTDASGQVRVTTTSGEEGTQSVTATLTDDLLGNEPNDVDECDRAQSDPAGAPAGRCSETVTKTWTAPEEVEAARLTLTPEESTDDPGNDQAITATVTDEDGEPVEGATITWTTTGGGAIESQETTTDENGHATAIVTSSEPGDQQVTASATPCASAGGCSDTAVVHWGPETCTIFGTNGPDTITGTSGKDVICAFGGNDRIRSGGSNDVVFAGKGRDRIAGGSGRDRLKGGGGKDNVAGGGGNDRLLGGAGNDVVSGGGGNDALSGGRGRDRLAGGAGDDDLDGGPATDSCNGGGGRNSTVRCER